MTSSQRRYPRTARLNEAVLEVLAEELERMNDPRLELVTLTEADVSRDLAHARVYYSAMVATADADDTAQALVSAAPHFQRVLGRELRIRQVPKLVFKVDPGIVAGQRIEEILREIHHDDVEKDEALPAGGTEEDV
ncbi:MAG TPA: 30S ribosome-binding factor RbfA [Acidimicrobiia bacterium]|jgi:ribosome-binding factor A|nr:30S ribosome-binding factor RbfA [Acidimicrobiia bacterium]